MFNMKIFTLIFLFVFTCKFSSAQKNDNKLQHKVQELTTGFSGTIGIYIKNLNNNKTVSINADTIFPTASIVKVPILVGVMDKVNRGELGYHQEVYYRDSLRYSDFDIQAAYRDSQKNRDRQTGDADDDHEW